ncbi:LysR family transcriptional regulator [Aeromonas taiwanensis]|uniref:LysR family transcriptional regulator n=1 Tax=Aeromonas taiwanensis TaxID=633417 RepID=A0A5F0KA90_9GAMM|nr:LysR family transcriptional regulator [Aeromonas taiwanensis]TFF74639.1 LysR family transcriptional regulator [Aeromonas taiwanensis]TFF75475.1 LysR family transcriptional regulator [Aeromonas taiwanensis]TFF78766.1 LysR family transcriptional regulator [Aeromonas taiwanensis]
MKLHQLDLNLLLAFDALMTQGSVTRAAESLFVSQPAMSHALNRLRTFFDDPLLVRTPQGMLPTARAQRLHLGVQQALRLLEQQLSEEDEFDPRHSKRRFVLCTTDYVECVLIPPLIQRLRGLAPGVTIEIRILRDTLPEAELASGEIDLVLGFDEYMQVPGYLGKETWLTEPLAGLVRADLPMATPGLAESGDDPAQPAERISLAQLIEMPHVFHSPLGTSEASLDRYLKSLGFGRTISVNSQSYMSAAAIVSQSDHLLVLPSMVAELLAHHWPLKSLPLPEDVPDYHLNCVWHPVHAQQPALVWLKALMRELVNQE